MERNYRLLNSLVLGCILLLPGCHGQSAMAEESGPPQPAETAAAVNEPAPTIEFEKVVHDFGQIDMGTTNVCEFKFTNTGNALLKITNITKTCGCTPYDLAKSDYEPSESGSLKVSYTAGKTAGSVTKHLSVYSNDKKNPQVELAIKAQIVSKVDYEPKNLDLSLKAENAGCPQITITSLDDQAFAIKQFRSTADCITADIDYSAQATKFVIQPKVDIEKLKDYLDGRIYITLTHPGCDSLIIPFTTPAKFKLTPLTLVVLNAVPQRPVPKELWIISNYDEDFEVESVSSQKGTVKVIRQEKLDKRYKFDLEITPPADKRFFTDVFYVNIKGGQQLEVPCRGFQSGRKENPQADKD